MLHGCLLALRTVEVSKMNVLFPLSEIVRSYSVYSYWSWPCISGEKAWLEDTWWWITWCWEGIGALNLFDHAWRLRYTNSWKYWEFAYWNEDGKSLDMHRRSGLLPRSSQWFQSGIDVGGLHIVLERGVAGCHFSYWIWKLAIPFFRNYLKIPMSFVGTCKGIFRCNGSILSK